MSPVFAQNNLYERHQESLLSLIQNNHQQKSTVERPRLGLVLSGGGARGISHVGVLKGFEKHDIPIDLIVGTSMGSVVGGFYAAGYSAEQLQKIIRSIDWNTIFSDATERENLFMGQKVESDRYLINLRFDGLQAYLPSSISSGQKILSIISDRLLKAEYQALSDFNNMKIPFRSIATDLVSGKRVVLSRGDLAEAINASVAVPLLFAPVRWDEMLLVDGGLSSNFAVDVARDFGMDLVVVVDITSPLRKRDEIRAPWEVADQVTTIMMQSQYEEQLSLADIVVRPDLEGIGSTDFAKYDEMIVQGEAAIDAIAEKLISATATTPYTVQIDSIRICGFQQLDEKLNVVNHFNSQLSAPKKEQVTLAMIKNDVDWLFGHGTFQAINARLADTTLTYIVTSNSKLNQIVISGNTIYPDSVIRGEISHPLQQVLNHNKIRDDLKSIRAMYQKDGYMLMDFNHIDFDSLNGILSVTIDEGHVDSIRISGNDLTERLVVLREFPLEPGDVINSKLIKRGIDNIYNTQLFEKVSANIDRSELGFILTIKLIEKKYTVLRLGGKVDSERGGQNYMELAHENLLGIGGKFSLLGRFGERDRNASINFRVDRIFRSFLTGGLHMYYHRLVNPVANIRSGEYVEERLGGRITIGQQLRKLGQMSVELRLENVKIFRESGSFTQSQDSDLRSITIRSVTDKRDKIGFTTKGIYNVWFWESGDQRFLGGQEKFTKAYINLEGYYTYWNNHTFHVRGVIGIGDKTLPFSEYFRIGGFNSFIGLHDYEFIGRQTILTNLEYRYKLPFQILADTFVGLRYDIGGIWEIPDLVLKGEDFFQGIGIWFGIDTFLGPLIIGAGDTNIRKAVVYLSLGYNF